MSALPQYVTLTVWRNAPTSIGNGPLVPASLDIPLGGSDTSQILAQITQNAPPEEDDNKGQTPLNTFTILTYKPAWTDQVNPDIRVGDRLRSAASIEYTVQGVKDVLGSYLEIAASTPRGV